MIRDHLQENENVKPNTAFLEELKNKLPEFFNNDGFDIDKFKNSLKENNINEFSEGYQLNFIGKDYARKQAGDAPTSVIVPDNEHNQKEENKNSRNLFFTGDNLEVLRHLRNNYSNKIDVIYIDPPYNTGNDDFVYPDKFEYSDKQLKEFFGMSDEDVLKLNALKGSKSHSAWLTFMYPRLWLAKKLLSSKGAIFISIDENEYANLKLLMDSIFGENNFIENIVWKKKSSAKGVPPKTMMAGIHEYILAYQKVDYKFVGEKRNDKDGFSNPDNDPRGPWRESNIRSTTLPESKAFTIVNPDTGERYTNTWAFSKDSLNKMIKEKRIIWKKTLPKQKEFLYEMTNDNKAIKSDFGLFDAQVNTVYLKRLMGVEKIFLNSKPIGLIKYLISVSASKNALILDFFAGSSTTADAVMQLNAEDGGNRKFIMVQLPEKTYELDKNGTKKPTKGGKAAFDAGYMSIDEVSRERIKRAAKKIRDDNPDLSEDFDGGFQHYRVVSPKKKILDKIYDFDSENYELVSDMVDSFSSSALGVSGNASGEDTILTTWLAEDRYDFNTDKLVKYNFAGYKAFGIKDIRLYLIDGNWHSEQTKDLLNQLGTSKVKFGSIVVYGYSFNVIDMKELDLGLSQLNSKVELIKRY